MELCQDYSQYYSIEELEDKIKNFEPNLGENFIDLIKSRNLDELFNFSVKYNLEDLAEYLYKYCGISFELNRIFSLSLEDKNRLKVLDRLLRLKKYSRLISKDKKFFYCFNPKYLSHF